MIKQLSVLETYYICCPNFILSSPESTLLVSLTPYPSHTFSITHQIGHRFSHSVPSLVYQSDNHCKPTTRFTKGTPLHVTTHRSILCSPDSQTFNLLARMCAGETLWPPFACLFARSPDISQVWIQCCGLVWPLLPASQNISWYLADTSLAIPQLTAPSHRVSKISMHPDLPPNSRTDWRKKHISCTHTALSVHLTSFHSPTNFIC